MDGPGVPAGVRVQQQAREIDALPTILDLLSGKASSAIQGTSMVPAFSGKTVPTTYSYEELCTRKSIWAGLNYAEFTPLIGCIFAHPGQSSTISIRTLAN